MTPRAPVRRPAAPGAAVQPVLARQFSLADISRGKVRSPRRVIVHGGGGVGKTTLVAGLADPLILDLERGSYEIDCTRVDSLNTFDDVMAYLDLLEREDHGFRTLGIDALDRLEAWIFADLCKKAGWDNIETPGYGKGYIAALDSWRQFVAKLESLQRAKGMDVYLIAHSQVKVFKDPSAVEDYERYLLKLDAKAAGFLKEWCYGLYYAAHERAVRQDSRKKSRGVFTGARYLYTKENAAYDAKDRYGLPEVLVLDAQEFEAALASGGAALIAGLLADIEAKLELVDSVTREKARRALDERRDDPQKLARLNEYLNAYVPVDGQEASNG